MKKNIIGDKIVYVRAKTSNTKKTLDPHIIKIELEIDQILKRYPKKSDYVFPILEPGLTDSTIRDRIKNMLKKISTNITEIASELKIECADHTLLGTAYVCDNFKKIWYFYGCNK